MATIDSAHDYGCYSGHDSWARMIVGVVVVVYFTMLHLSGATLDKDQSNTALLLYKKGYISNTRRYKSENLLKVSTVWLV